MRIVCDAHIPYLVDAVQNAWQGVDIFPMEPEEITPSAVRDADVLINTTPVGMYPDNGETPVDLDVFDGLSGVLDVVYNPLRTALVLQARERGIPSGGGLPMLAMQAVAADRLFFDRKADEEAEKAAAERILQELAEQG